MVSSGKLRASWYFSRPVQWIFLVCLVWLKAMVPWWKKMPFVTTPCDFVLGIRWASCNQKQS